jgi:hypothetical protein
MTYIYLVTNCFNNPNDVYIGKTKNNRKSAHKKTYGENIIYSDIDKVDSLKREDWEPLETYWIQQFITWGFNVVNKNKKGGGGPEFWTDESKNKLKNNKERSLKISKTNTGQSRTNKDKPLTQEHINKIKQTRGFLKNRSNTWQNEPVIQKTLDGEFVAEWSSQIKATTALGKTGDGIGACCRGRQKQAYGYIWEFKNKNKTKTK